MSAEKIKKALDTKIKHVFKTALRCLEIKFGTGFEGYEQMRAEILRVGNNAIRELKELVNEEFGIEEPDHETKVRINRRV